ncbi:MAG: YitT family protein [Cetobacterium sp.]
MIFNNLSKEKLKRKKLKILQEYLYIYIGTFVASIVINRFLVSPNLAFGGTTGLSFLSLNVEFIKKFILEIDKIIDYPNPSNIFLGTLYGELLIEIGLGIILKNGGTTGGSDILSGVFKFQSVSFNSD